MGLVLACPGLMCAVPSHSQVATGPISYEEALICYGIMRYEDDGAGSVETYRTFTRAAEVAQSMGQANGKTEAQIKADLERAWQQIYDFDLRASKGSGDPAAKAKLRDGVRSCLSRFGS